MKPTLDITHPEIAAQWHPTKNGELRPCDVTSGSGKKVWWKCKVAEDHEWETRVVGRTKGGGCPCCSVPSKKVVKSNCLATMYPEIAVQWHFEKNGKLTPDDVMGGSNKKVWWKCDKKEDHEWEALINSRTNQNHGCPCCAGQKIVKSNCLKTTHPKIAKQWHKTKNGELKSTDVGRGSHKMVWWQCGKVKDHEWKTYIGNRVFGKGCPYCAGQKTSISNCLATTHPEIASQWHPCNELKPTQVTAGADEYVWWQCKYDKSHKWKAKIYHRTGSESNCPICRSSKNERLIEDILIKMNISFIREWRTVECRAKRPLPFDFAILHNGKVIALVEYQGAQHFILVDYRNGNTDIKCLEIALANIKKRDKIKKKFCNHKKIPFLAINYWQNTEKLVKKFIDKLDFTTTTQPCIMTPSNQGV